MANNCLVTKLKSVVNNPLLPKTTDLVLDVISYSPFNNLNCIVANSNGNTTMEMPNGNFLNDSGDIIGTTVNIDGSERAYYPTNAGGRILIHDRDRIRTLKLNGNIWKLVNVKDLTYLERLLSVTLTCSGKTEDIVFPNATEMIIASDNVSGDISVINVPKVKTLYFTRTNTLTGNIQDCAKYQQLAKLVVNYCNITGSIEGLVNAFRMRAINPLTTGSIKCAANNCPVTFNGIQASVTSSNTDLSWTANTITWGDVTINA